MKFGIVTFPGSNGDYDAYRAPIDALGEDAAYLWHKDHDLQGADVVVLPGGFSYGDYLRAGAIARFSPIMREVIAHARRGGPVLCICNGFQIALRAGCFADGVTLGVNDSGTFHDKPDQVHIVAEDADSPWLTGLQGQELVFPCAHGEGRFVHSGPGQWRCALRYPPEANPDGSMDNIAGITDSTGRVLGLMDHPERAIHRSDNLAIFANGVDAAR
jgi:phosphoribosylformylglycinamidine synthase I